mmetsp:Transcript_75086/g.202836  ORF Transcript_75086/g.202836 Transcript_75086/m.202836 type:complete len:242 (+) Transcript_75086:53-778(+)
MPMVAQIFMATWVNSMSIAESKPMLSWMALMSVPKLPQIQDRGPQREFSGGGNVTTSFLSSASASARFKLPLYTTGNSQRRKQNTQIKPTIVTLSTASEVKKAFKSPSLLVATPVMSAAVVPFPPLRILCHTVLFRSFGVFAALSAKVPSSNVAPRCSRSAPATPVSAAPSLLASSSTNPPPSMMAPTSVPALLVCRFEGATTVATDLWIKLRHSSSQSSPKVLFSEAGSAESSQATDVRE